MADARLKAVIPKLAEMYTRSHYLIDMVNQLREPLENGDVVEVPSLGALTVTEDGSTGAAGQDPTVSVLSCQANKHPAIFADLKQMDKIQLLDGKWATEVARQGTEQLKASMDNSLLRDYLIKSLMWDTAASYHINVAGDALNDDDILTAKAELGSYDGANPQNFGLLVHPFGEASIMSISGFVPNAGAAEAGILGIPKLGSVFGVPVYSTNAVPRGAGQDVTRMTDAATMTAVASASNVASNVCTFTVPSGHGFVPGMKVWTKGFTTNIAVGSAVAISSVTATTIVVPLTASNGSNGTGTIYPISALNVMVDLSHVHVAQQAMPQTRMVQKQDSTDDQLQIWSIWGRVGRSGRAFTIHSPANSPS